MKTSLIITTYNWPESLELILKSILLQTEFPNEIIIADDGSKIETTNLINYYKKISNIPIIHIWQEDLGFRASEVRNKAIKECNYEYIIQIDGDTVLHKDFIKDHKNLATKNCFISGSRVLVGKETTAKKLKI
jgi:glycosyltransferase involved in cell wall biosynthesis